jgi:hypothetical protein
MAKRRVSLDDFERKHKRPKAQLELPDEKQVWLTRPQAAAYLAMGVSTLAKLDMAGKGPPASHPTPNSVRYRREDLDLWMAAAKPVPQAAE